MLTVTNCVGPDQLAAMTGISIAMAVKVKDNRKSRKRKEKKQSIHTRGRKLQMCEADEKN